MSELECQICGRPSAKLLTATSDFRVGFGHKPRPYAAGTMFCNLHLQEALIEGHPYYQLTDADSTEKVIHDWLSELRDWLRSEDMEVYGWMANSRCYHLVSHCIKQPGEDMEKLKYFLSLTMIGVRGIDVNDQGKFY